MADIYGVLLSGTTVPIPTNGIVIKAWLPAAVSGGTLPAQGAAEPGTSPVATATSGPSTGADGSFLISGIDPGRYFVSWTIGGVVYWSERIASAATAGEKNRIINAAGGLSVGYTSDQLAGAAGVAVNGVTNTTTLAVGAASAAVAPLEVKASSGQAAALYSASVGAAAYLVIADNAPATSKWQVGKKADHSFYINDVTRAADVLQVAANGNMTLMPSGGSLNVGGVLSVSGNFSAAALSGLGAASPTANQQLTVKSTGTGVIPVVIDSPVAQSAALFDARVNAVSLVRIENTGVITLGGDTQIYRTGANNLQFGGTVSTIGPFVPAFGQVLGTNTIQIAVGGDAAYRYMIDNTGRMLWGDGSHTQDTFLKRLSAGVLKTDGNLLVAGHLLGGGGTPAATAGVALGSSPATPTFSAAATDQCGTISCTAVAGATFGVVFRITYANSFAVAPIPVLTAASGPAAGIIYQTYVSAMTTTYFEVTTTTGLTSSYVYLFNWVLAGAS